MENQSSKSLQAKVSNLDSLPASDDKEFWGDADVHSGIVPQQMFDNEHFFVRVSGHGAYCTHCSWGFALDPGDKVGKDGHVYTRQDKLVI